MIVEGDAEFHALRSLHRRLAGCPPLRLVNLGGVGGERDPTGIAHLVAPKVRQLRLQGCDAVVVCIDRERRPRCAAGFAADVAASLHRRLEGDRQPTDGVGIVVADRAFEAWLLAGSPELLSPRSRWRPPLPFEGSLGSENRLGKVELGQMLERRYAEAVDGPRLFGRMDLTRARERSRSLDKLLRTVLSG